MGQCAFSMADTANAKPDSSESPKKQHDYQTSKKKKQVKILLLGTGNSGKSTVFKQFQREYKNGFSPAEKEFYKETIMESTISSIRKLAQNANDFLFECGIEGIEDVEETKLDESKGIEVMWRNAIANNPDIARITVASSTPGHTKAGNERTVSKVKSAEKDVRDMKSLPVSKIESPTQPLNCDDFNIKNHATLKPGYFKSAANLSNFSNKVTPYIDIVSSLPEGTKLWETFPVTVNLRKSNIENIREAYNRDVDLEVEVMSVSSMLKAIWNDPLIQRVYAMESKMPTLEAPLDYYLTHIDRFSEKDFSPTEEDILRARKQTRLAQQLHFTMDTNKEFLLIDPGGQKSERRKWIAHFDYTEVVLFVVGMDGYNQLCIEDGKTNRMRESLELFKDVCECPFFESTNFVLFLNKEDIFREKIKEVPLNVCFKGYDGQEHNAKQGIEYVRKRFQSTFYRVKFNQMKGNTKESKTMSNAEPMVYIFLTSATSCEDMERILKVATKHIFLRIAMAQVGMA